MAVALGQETPLRYLSAAEVDRCLPDVNERLDLAERAVGALGGPGGGEAEMPPKIGVHPREGALLHAMPAWLRDGDLVGLKWVAAYPGNRAAGLPAINGLVVLNDAETGLPTWIMDAARITAVRTAAVSGVALRMFAGSGVTEERRVAILGAGTQGRSHIEMVAAVLPGASVEVFDRHADRAEALAAEARAAGLSAEVAAAREAAGRCSVILTMATLGSSNQVMTADWVDPHALVVAVDFATYVSAELARGASIFAVDDRDQFLAYRASGYFDRYPEPSATMGELLGSRDHTDSAAQGDGPIVVTHLGVGLADVVLADAIARRAASLGAGVELPR